MLLDIGGDCELPCRKAIERKSMENLLQVLKEATLFILTTQLFRHLLPGKKYLPYENVILSMAVLSMLIVPILSVVNADLPGEFGERVALLETEMRCFRSIWRSWRNRKRDCFIIIWQIRSRCVCKRRRRRQASE